MPFNEPRFIDPAKGFKRRPQELAVSEVAAIEARDEAEQQPVEQQDESAAETKEPKRKK